MAANEQAGRNQKLKMLYLAKIFLEETDDLHSLTMQEIISKLESYEVNANRRTLYKDFEELRNFGYDIVSTKIGRECYYQLVSRDFELPELKLLVDSVQSAKFITNKKSNELIKKLESLVSRYEGKQLQRQVVMSGRIKTMNESIYYNVDKIHEAINSDSQIKFKYFQWNIKKEMELRKNGSWYQVSPWALMWDDENYYLVAYDADDKKIKHYRVDKMLKISVQGEKREGKDQFKAFDMPKYTKSLFGMYGGEETSVTIECKNYLAGVMIDRFGKDIFLIPIDDSHFRTTVNVAFSDQFLGWIFALGDGVRIVAPDNIIKLIQTKIKELDKQYLSE